MEKTIGDYPDVAAMLVNKKNVKLPVNHPNAIGWKCMDIDDKKGCGGTWRENVFLRAKRCATCTCGHPHHHKIISHTKPTPIVEKKTFAKQECPICCLESKNICECGTCKYKACIECTKTYILGGVGIGRCMNVECNQPFETAVLMSMMTKKWVISEYLPFINRSVVDHEKSLIPATMKLAQRTMEYNNAYIAHENSNKALRDYRGSKVSDIDNKEGKRLRAIARNTLYEKDRTFRRMGDEKFALSGNASDKKKKEQIVVYVQGCPIGECKGLIDDKGVCSICRGVMCLLCRCTVSTEHRADASDVYRSGDSDKHRCNPVDIESVKELKSTTKPCPKCAAAIYKVDGCDQMWCVSCHVTFSWSTGRIELGRTHNPHYFAWLREQSNGDIPRVPENDECVNTDNMIDYLQNILSTTSLHKLPIEEHIAIQTKFTEICGAPTRANFIGGNGTVVSLRCDLRDLRANYIIGIIPEEKWVKKVGRLYRSIRHIEYANMMHQTMSDILTDLIRLMYMRVKANHDVLEEYYKFVEQALSAKEMINKEIVMENCDMDYGKFKVYDNHFYLTLYKVVRVEK